MVTTPSRGHNNVQSSRGKRKYTLQGFDGATFSSRGNTCEIDPPEDIPLCNPVEEKGTNPSTGFQVKKILREKCCRKYTFQRMY